MTNEVYWCGQPAEDDFGVPVKDVLYDARTRHGPWALMTEESWRDHRAAPNLGTGCGQKYEKQPDGRFLKVAG